MEYLSLIFLHVLFGVIWAGGAIAAGFFFVPAVLDAGPAGGAVMAGVVKRKLPIVLSVAAAIVLLSGIRLYMLRFTTTWIVGPEGIVLTLGAVLGIGAFVLGVFFQKPIGQQLTDLAGQIAASGKPPSPEQARELDTLKTRMRKIAALTSWHLIGAVTLMSIHRLAAAF